MINSEGGKPKRLTFSGKYNTDPAWSPDGSTIAFARIINGVFNIWLMRADGKGLRQLTQGSGNKSPAWSPDSKHIIFSSEEKKGGSTLYIIRSDGSELRKLDPAHGNESAPTWSPAL